ncbi:hypothetical protein PUN28_004116 [Cardiocondyla obscurior]|uniref:Uncharacterized protein n=1 Tax=Cardiocondyla obscurior TaxID=286306 RepID=A0AAW2GPN7_9HYME
MKIVLGAREIRRAAETVSQETKAVLTVGTEFPFGEKLLSRVLGFRYILCHCERACISYVCRALEQTSGATSFLSQRLSAFSKLNPNWSS